MICNEGVLLVMLLLGCAIGGGVTLVLIAAARGFDFWRATRIPRTRDDYSDLTP